MIEVDTEIAQPSYEPTAGSRAFRGGLWQALAQIAPYLYTTVLAVVAARILGPERMGRQSFIAFSVLAGQTICAAGIGSALLRYVGELRGRGHEARLPTLLRLAWQFSALTGAAGGAALLTVAIAGAQPRWAWVFGAVAVLAGTLHRAPGTFLISLQRWRTHAVIMLVTGAVSVAATVVVLALGGGITGMLAVTAVTAVAMLLWTTAIVRRLVDARHREPLASVRSEVVKFALASTVPVLLGLVVLQRSELFFLERFSTNQQIALYSIAFSATAALVAVPTAIGAVLTPSVATLLGSSDHERIRRSYARVLRLGLLFALPLTTAALALGPELLRLVYGDRYRGAGSVFLIVVATLPLVPLAGASQALLTGYGRVRLPIVVNSIAAAVDVGLAAALVPRLDAIGAAIANTSAFLVAGVLLILYARRLVGAIDIDFRSVLRVGAVSLVASVSARVVLLAGNGALPFVAAVAVEVAALTVAAFAVRVLPEDDALFLIRVAGGHVRVARVLNRLSRRTPLPA